MFGDIFSMLNSSIFHASAMFGVPPWMLNSSLLISYLEGLAEIFESVAQKSSKFLGKDLNYACNSHVYLQLEL